MTQHEPLTSKDCAQLEIDANEIIGVYSAYKVNEALEGLKEELREHFEDDLVLVEWEDKILPMIDKWFPFAHQIKTAEFDKGCEEFHKEWDEAGKGEGVLK
jgi:tRNA A37 threonylcarbamoyladenosine biosynthesis protein TsaE